MEKREYIQLVIPLASVVGDIVLGVQNPNTIGPSAITVLATGVGGFYGATSPRKDSNNDGIPDNLEINQINSEPGIPGQSQSGAGPDTD